MEKWWKSPVLQGEENDYGKYDYLINEIPKDTVHWTMSNCVKCNDCGHYGRPTRVEKSFFRNLDGYDSLGYNECIFCIIKDKIYPYTRFFRKIIKKIKNKK